MKKDLSPFRKFIDLLIPLRCLKCGDILAQQEGLCASCWSEIPFLSDPYCACCGLPFDFEIEEGSLCGACAQSPPPYTQARSVFAYTPDSRDLILKFKHLDHLSSAPFFASWMSQVIEKIDDPICIPVPLHWTRLLKRTYNQAALLAQEIARIKKGVYAPTLLKRKTRTPSQGSLSKKEREKNVKQAFFVPEKKKIQISGKKIILVDDVFASGATLKACARAFLKAEAQGIYVVTLARVVRATAMR